MTIPSVSYGLYAPTQLKVISLGVGISDDTNSNLDLRNQQALIVAERLQSVSGSPDRKTYGLIVDNEGIAINTSLVSRAAHSNLYHLYVDGDVRVKGNMVVDGILYGRDGSNLFSQVGSGSSGSGNANYWVMSDDNYFNNIYFAGTATLGNNSAASNNNFVLNIVSSAHGDVDQTHISLQNLNAAQLRLGVIGTAPNAPIVFNTNAITNADGELGGAIEFHVGRDSDYFHQIYYGSNSWGDVPEYTDVPAYMAPHMKIDERGNVGIHTSANRAISFNLRQLVANTQSISYNPKSEPVALHVEGYTYSCNVIVWDYESGKTCNIDDLYVRKLGVALPANQVIPGTYANGDYTFPWNVTVDRDITTDSAHVNKLIVDDAIINTSMFYDDAVFNHDIIANQSLRIRGQIYTEVLSNVEIDGTSNYSFQMIQWTPASPSLTNINLIGQGISTPGRLGVGVDPNAYNPVNGQVSIYKNNSRIWELELYDNSSTMYRSRAAFIGHPLVDGAVNNGLDGSLVIATPYRTDPNYAGRYSEFPQNIYFYPGADMSAAAQTRAFLTSNVKPTLGVFNIKKTATTDLHAVGINTYNPSSELDVNGSITFSGDLIYSPPNATPVSVGIWRQTTYADVKVNYQNYFNGISYVSPLPSGAHVGINTVPDSTYGLVIAGITRFNDGIYMPDTNNVDRRMGVWMDNRDAVTVNNNVAPTTRNVAGDVFTWSGVGVGVKNPNANIEIKNNYSANAFSNIGTSLQLTQGSIPLSSIIYQGSTTSDVWKMQVVHESSAFPSSIFQMGFGTDAFSASNVKRYLWMKPPNPLSGILSSNTSSSLHPQVVIGADLNVFSNSSNTDPSAYLTVGGNVSVLGDVSISGQFKMKGLVVQNNNIVTSEQQAIPDMQSDDVYISGGHVQLNPSTGKTIILGNPRPITGATTLDPIIDNDNALLRVYAPAGVNSTGVIATFLTNNNNALIKLSAGNNNKLLFGAVDAGSSAYANTPFVFMNENNKVYMSFYQSAAVSGTEFFVGVGVPLGQTVGSKMHIYSSGTGENMLRLTKAVYADDTTDDAPQIDLQKNYQYSANPNSLSSTRQAPTTWTMKGAIASWNQKLSFIHKTPTYPGNSYSTEQTTYEPFCITPQGCVGIGNTQPQFAVDILNTANIGGLRIRDTGFNAAPHIVLQSGESRFGSDSNIDYRIATSNNIFRVESEDSIHGLKTIMDVSENNNVGIRGLATSEYNITLYGSVNITNTLSVGGSDIQSFLNNSLNVASVNIFLSPNRALNGGIVINNANASSGTGNLLHVFSGNTGINTMNMMVYDSEYNQAQVHYRTQEVNVNNSFNGYYNMYRTGMGGNSFYWKYYPRCGNNYYVPDNDVGYSNVMNVAPTSRRTAAEYDLTVNGSIVCSSTVNPGVYLGSMGAVGASNGNVYINAYGASNGNVGIGTFVPQNRLHVYGSNAGATGTTGSAVVRVEQRGTGDIMALYGSNTVNPLFNVSASGVSVGRKFYADYGSAALPSFSFASTPSDTTNIYSGLYLTTSNAVAVSTSGVERMRVERSGAVNIGGGGRQFATLSVVSSNINTGVPAVNIVQYGRDNLITMVGYTGTSNVVSGIGNVGIGTTNPLQNLHVAGTILIEGFAQFNQDLDINGNIYVDGNAYVAGNEITGLMNTNTSDRRLKKDFEKITHALDKVKSLTGYTFARIEEKYSNKRFTGLIAQEVAEVLPEAVVEYSENVQEEKYLSLAYGNMMGLIVEAIKELSDEVASLREFVHLQR